MTVPFICVFVGYLLIYLPRFAVVKAIVDLGEGYDNNDPREQKKKLKGWGTRAEAAHLNGFESFMGFAAAVVVAHLAGADPAWSERLALTYVAARAVYPVLYIAGVGSLRSAVWFVSFGATLGLFTLPWWG